MKIPASFVALLALPAALTLGGCAADAAEATDDAIPPQLHAVEVQPLGDGVNEISMDDTAGGEESGLPTGKRMHKPFVVIVDADK